MLRSQPPKPQQDFFFLIPTRQAKADSPVRRPAGRSPRAGVLLYFLLRPAGHGAEADAHAGLLAQWRARASEHSLPRVLSSRILMPSPSNPNSGERAGPAQCAHGRTRRRAHHVAPPGLPAPRRAPRRRVAWCGPSPSPNGKSGASVPGTGVGFHGDLDRVGRAGVAMPLPTGPVRGCQSGRCIVHACNASSMRNKGPVIQLNWNRSRLRCVHATVATFDAPYLARPGRPGWLACCSC